MGPLTVDEAVARVSEGIAPLPAETVPLEEAYGRVLSEDVAARMTQPPFDASAMDGYAVRAADIAKPPCTLEIIGEAAAGHAFMGRVEEGQATRIFTGAPLPDGSDTILIQENTERSGDMVRVIEGAAKADFVRPRGFDFAEDDVLLRAGKRLTSRDLTLIAAMNHKQVRARRRPRVAILATGDELVFPGETPAPDQIISSIPYCLAAMIESAGATPERLGIAKDTVESLDAHVARAEAADILLTIGGASVGEHDLVRKALEARGMKLDFWKIAMRPGKPLMFGRLGAQRILGVPGNPVSAIICGRIFLIPQLRGLLGRDAEGTGEQSARLAEDLPANGPRQHYMRATSGIGPDGDRVVTPVRSQDSSLMSPLVQADCLIVQPPRAPAAKAGDPVRILGIDF